MKALMFYGGSDMRLEDIPEPAPGAEEVKIRVKWCGVCGSDIHEYRSGPILVPTKRPHPRTGKLAPVVGGHEFAGEVVEVGSEVSRIKPGDRVTVKPTLPCYRCHFCQQGRHIQCSSLALLGGAADGAFAEYIVAPAENVHKLPGGVSYEAGSFTEPLACAVHAIKRGGMKPGDNVAVVGAGPIGLLTMQAALACGAAQVVVFEMTPERAALAEKLGASAVIDPSAGNAGKTMAGLTDGLRADVSFECAGPAPALLLANEVCGKGGVIVEVGFMAGKCEFPFQDLFLREKSIVTSQGYVDEFPAALALMANGRVQCEPMITAKIFLEEVMDKGILAMLGPEKMKQCKILVAP